MSPSTIINNLMTFMKIAGKFEGYGPVTRWVCPDGTVLLMLFSVPFLPHNTFSVCWHWTCRHSGVMKRMACRLLTSNKGLSQPP